MVALILTVTAIMVVQAVPVQARTAAFYAAHSHTSPGGGWTRLGLDQGGNWATFAPLPNGNDLVVWSATSHVTQHYEWVELKPTGGLATVPKDVFGGRDWGGLGQYPVLVLEKGKPLLVFEGSKADANKSDPYNDGCIVGDLLTAGGWKLQPWSLSQNCIQTDHMGATVTQNGTLSAAWAWGAIHFRIGTSPSIPAGTPDQLMAVGQGGQGAVGETTDNRSQHVYAVWDRFFSKPPSKDGLYVADLTKKSSPMRAPSTGTNLVSHEPQPRAIASPTGRGGIYVAYCNNAWPCTQVKLWRYGAKRAVSVPGASLPTTVAMSAGPSGRLWIAWWSAQKGTVRVVRTNEAGSKFGPVETHAGPRGCQSDGNATVGISHGSQQRLDVVIGCYGVLSGTNYQNQAYAIQSLVPLEIAASSRFVSHKKGGKVTYRVSDVGDAVQGATVTVDGKKGITDKKGQVTFQFPKGAKSGKFKVVASKGDYLNASTSLKVA
jgi:hypothetical protein